MRSNESTLPGLIQESKWKDDIAFWSPVEFGQIYVYVIDMPGQFKREKIKACKSLNVLINISGIVFYACCDHFYYTFPILCTLSGWIQKALLHQQN